MDVTPDLVKRTRASTDDIEDLALTFVETELGRYDWNNNWAKMKASGTSSARIAEWLLDTGSRNDATDLARVIETYIDRLCAQQSPGRWT